ncbi:hypothetical protein D3C74_383360 [compost metagenome]
MVSSVLYKKCGLICALIRASSYSRLRFCSSVTLFSSSRTRPTMKLKASAIVPISSSVLAATTGRRSPLTTCRIALVSLSKGLATIRDRKLAPNREKIRHRAPTSAVSRTFCCTSAVSSLSETTLISSQSIGPKRLTVTRLPSSL